MSTDTNAAPVQACAPLVETRAKVGVFSIALGAYLPQFPQLVPNFEQQYADFLATLPTTVDIIDGGMVTTKEAAQEAGDKFRAADVDLVILQMLTYATSYNVLPAVRDLNVPVVVVNVQKKAQPDYAATDIPTWLGDLYACGAPGEVVADLNRAGKRHAVITGVVEGGDPEVARQLDEWCRAAQVRRRLRRTNIAQIGRPYPGMMDLYIDETNLYNRLGLYTKQFDWEKMWAIADNVDDRAAIDAKAAEILDTFDVEGGAAVSDEPIQEMARYVLAFEQWVRDEEIGLVASHYDGYAPGAGRRAGLHAHPRVLDAHQAGDGLRRRGRHEGRRGHEHLEDHSRHGPALGDVLHRLPRGHRHHRALGGSGDAAISTAQQAHPQGGAGVPRQDRRRLPHAILSGARYGDVPRYHAGRRRSF